MVCAPVRSIIPSLKLGDYISVQGHKPCSISHMLLTDYVTCGIAGIELDCCCPAKLMIVTVKSDFLLTMGVMNVYSSFILF